MTTRQQLTLLREKADAFLDALFREDTPWATLQQAMRYSLNAGGKRIRPVLTMAFCAAAGGDIDAALPFGCGLELLHTYSLIHDDLPCMDNDDLRRGLPTSHIRFGEGVAVLAGDALQTAAFECILSCEAPAPVRAAAALELARSAGVRGMCAGQMLDIAAQGQPLEETQLRLIHRKKTGALLECACVLGVLAAGGNAAQLDAARCYAGEIGMAFQIRDDLLDYISTTDALGKPVGSDAENDKTTFYTLWGKSGCQAEIDTCTQRAKKIAADAFAECDFLCGLADELAGRMR